MKKFYALGILLACVSFASPFDAKAQERSAAFEAIVKAAQSEQSLNLIWGPSLGAAVGARALQDGLNKKYGTSITINFTPGPSFPQVASRVVQEIQAGRPASTDVLLGAETTISSLLASKALEQVEWSKVFSHIRPEMQTENGEAVHIVTLFTGIYYNTKFVKPNEVPKKIDDVFNPRWKGKIASTPYAGTFDRLAVLHGAEKIRPIVQKTSQWAGGLIRCGEYERLATGEFVLFFFDCGRGDERLSVANGGPLEQAVLEDAAITTNWFFGVPKNSSKPNLAKLFSAFVVTREGQEIIQKHGYTSSHYVEGTPTYLQAKELEKRGATIITQSPDFLLKHQGEIEKYREEFQKIMQTR